jgi:hypothetical protein
VEDEPVLAGLAAASVQGRVAMGARAGAAIRRRGVLRGEAPRPIVRGPCHAAVDGFDLDATVRVPAGARDHLERVCRYALRPPIAQDRIRLTPEGDVLLELRHRWSDGTTHLCFHPTELLERLASLTPRPRINLVLYHGVLAAHAAWRARLPRPGDVVVTAGFDVLACPRCGGRFRLVALIEHAGAVQRILRHLGLPAEVPRPRPARAPPQRPVTPIAPWDFDTP